MEEAGVTLEASTGLALARSLEAVAAARPGSSGLVGALATRAMSEAEYFSAGVPPAARLRPSLPSPNPCPAVAINTTVATLDASTLHL